MVRILAKTPVHVIDKEGRTALLSVGEHDVESYVAAAMEKMGRAVILSENTYLIEQGITNDDIGDQGGSEPNDEPVTGGEPEPGSIEAYIKANQDLVTGENYTKDACRELANFHEQNPNHESVAVAASSLTTQVVAEQSTQTEAQAPAKKAKQTKGA